MGRKKKLKTVSINDIVVTENDKINKNKRKYPKKKYDTDDYLWKENGINKLCINCKNICKQHGSCIIVKCPKFIKK